MPDVEPAAAAASKGTAAVRSYLGTTLTPVLLKALLKMEELEEPCAAAALSPHILLK